MLFLYTAWFRDIALPTDRSNREWSACIVIDADTDHECREWGNYLAMQRVTKSNSLELISATVEKAESWPQKKIQNVPRVRYGEKLSNQQIGW